MKRIGVALLLVASLCVLGAGPADAGLCGKTITHNITLRGDVHCKQAGLIVGADNIVINLHGFQLVGRLNGFDGITVQGHTNVTIKNGTVTHFHDGIVFNGATNSFIKHVTALTNNGTGVHLKSSSNGNQITSTLFRNNVGHGLLIENSASTTVTGCNSKKNVGQGYFLTGAGTTGTVLTNDKAFHNVGDGFNIQAGTTGTVSSGLSANTDTGIGIDIGASDAGSTIANSTANDNQSFGIVAQDPGQDLGGNSAAGNNGGGMQCVNVNCS